MHFSKINLCLAAVLSTAAALPSLNLDDSIREKHSVHQVAAGRKKHGALALASIHAKYGKEPHADVARAAASRASRQGLAPTQTGSVQASNTPSAYDLEYLVNMTIGTQTFLIDFDTGSSDLWVASTLLPQSQQGDHRLYNLGGKKQAGEEWGISYAHGTSSSGVVYADKVVIGGVTATSMAVEAATSMAPGFVTREGQDGLLGLGFVEGNTCYPYYCNTFMDNVQATLPQKVFTSTLRRGKPGTYDFGFIDPKKYTGTIAYTPIQDYQGMDHWEVYTHGSQVGTNKKDTNYEDVIFDTGASLALVEPSIVKQFYAKIAGTRYNSTLGAWIFPCSAESKLPYLSYWIENAKRTMPGYLANYASLADDGIPGMCYGGVQSNENIGFTILGDVFLKSVFVVYDKAKKRVGVAQRPDVPV